MVRNLLFVAASLLFGYVAAQDQCGSPNPSDHLIATHRTLAGYEQAGNFSHLGRRDNSVLTIDLYFHVVESEDAEGGITNKMVADQYDVLQKTFGQYGVQYCLKGITFTVNDTWANATTQQANHDMRVALRQGDYATLNIYIVTSLPKIGGQGTLLGDCTFPISITVNTSESDDADDTESYLDPTALVDDGCRIVSDSLPDPTSDSDFNLGYTAVHEIGHWFGLLHTFQGNACTGEGDQIADTRIQMTLTDGCPQHKDSCPNVQPSGDDPFHNFMDYSSDICLTNFTPLQEVRALGMFAQYRADFASTSSNTSSTCITPPISSNSTTNSTNSMSNSTNSMSNSTSPLGSLGPFSNKTSSSSLGQGQGGSNSNPNSNPSVTTIITTYYNQQCGCMKTGTAIISTYYDQQCGCTKTSTSINSRAPTPVTSTVTTTYFNQQCGCTTSSAYLTTITPTAPRVVSNVSATRSGVAASTAMPSQAGNVSAATTLRNPAPATFTGAASSVQHQIISFGSVSFLVAIIGMLLV